jgi:hypothetical protein
MACSWPGLASRRGRRSKNLLVSFHSFVVGDCLSSVDCLLESPNWRVSGENMEKGTCRLLPCRKAEEDGVRSGKYILVQAPFCIPRFPLSPKSCTSRFSWSLQCGYIYPLKGISDKRQGRIGAADTIMSASTAYYALQISTFMVAASGIRAPTPRPWKE